MTQGDATAAPSSERLTDAAREALSLHVPERCAFIMRDRFITHEQIYQIFRYTDMLVNAPRRSRARGLIVAGAPGAGKTALADALIRRYPERPAQQGLAAALPLTRITMTGAKMSSEIYVRTMSALGVPHPERYRGKDAGREVIRFLAQARLRVLIVDEIQDVMNRTPFQLRETLESVKFLMNESGVAIVALGTDEAERAVACDAHLRARFRSMKLSRWTTGPHLANFLSELERCLPLPEPSRLASTGMMRQIVRSTGGTLDAILTLVNTAACLAVEAGEERISPSFLTRAEEDIPAFYGTYRSEL
jgi:hypothetical protein